MQVVEFTVFPGQMGRTSTRAKSLPWALTRPIKHRLFNCQLAGPLQCLSHPSVRQLSGNTNCSLFARTRAPGPVYGIYPGKYALSARLSPIVQTPTGAN